MRKYFICLISPIGLCIVLSPLLLAEASDENTEQNPVRRRIELVDVSPAEVLELQERAARKVMVPVASTEQNPVRRRIELVDVSPAEVLELQERAARKVMVPVASTEQNPVRRRIELVDVSPAKVLELQERAARKVMVPIASEEEFPDIVVRTEIMVDVRQFHLDDDTSDHGNVEVFNFGDSKFQLNVNWREHVRFVVRTSLYALCAYKKDENNVISCSDNVDIKESVDDFIDDFHMDMEIRNIGGTPFAVIVGKDLNLSLSEVASMIPEPRNLWRQLRWAKRGSLGVGPNRGVLGLTIVFEANQYQSTDFVDMVRPIYEDGKGVDDDNKFGVLFNVIRNSTDGDDTILILSLPGY